MARFNSSSFVFRPTSMSLALVAACVPTASLSFVREHHTKGLLRARTDKDNNQPSIRVPLVFNNKDTKKATKPVAASAPLAKAA